MNYVEQFEIPLIGTFYISCEKGVYKPWWNGCAIGGTGWNGGYGNDKGFKSIIQTRKFIHLTIQNELDGKVNAVHTQLGILEATKTFLGNDSFNLGFYLKQNSLKN